LYLTLSHLAGSFGFHAHRAIERHWLGLESAGSVQLRYPVSGSPDNCYW
jgi:hypothetical protein